MRRQNPFCLILILLTGSAVADAAKDSHPINIPPGNGVTFGQVDWPGLPQPVFDSGTGVMKVNLADVRKKIDGGKGYLNAGLEGSWFARNLPIMTEEEYPYPEIMTTFFLGTETGTDVETLMVSITISPEPVIDPEFTQFFTYEVEPEPVWLGGLNAPVVMPPPPPPSEFVDSLIPEPVLDHASAQVVQHGHPNVNTARNQCYPMAIANSLQFLENTTDLDISQPHTTGLAPQGVSDGTLVGDIEAETGRSSTVTSRTNSGATGTGIVDGLRAKLKFLSKNSLADDIQTRHFGGNFDGISTLSEGSGANTATSSGFGAGLGIADLINSLRDGQDCELIYFYPGGGGHAVELIGAGISGGLPWTITASDLAQTDQGDLGDQNLGPSQGFEFSLMSDRDGDGYLEFPDGRELVSAVCQKYVGTPPETVSQTVTDVDTDDPAGHSCCVSPPGSSVEVTRDGSDLLIDGPGDGFPLRGWMEASGDFFASSIMPVAGFPEVTSRITGQFAPDGTAPDVELTIGALGELFGVPITYTFDLGPPAARAKAARAKASAESSGGLLRINSGETLTVPAGQTYVVNGMLYNEGTVVVSKGATLRNNGIVDNRGSLVIRGTLEGQGVLESTGSFTNEGDVHQNGITQLHDSGTASNRGDWTLVEGSRLLNAASLDNDGNIELAGHLANRGSISGAGRIAVDREGQLDNFAALGGKVTNNGRLVNVCDALLEASVTGNGTESFCRLFAQPSGIQMTPFVASSNVGTVEFSLDHTGRDLRYVISLPGLDLDGSRTPGKNADDIVAVEIRRGDFWENGSLAFSVFDDPDLVVDAEQGTLSGRWNGMDAMPLSKNLVQRLLDETLYLEVSTKKHRGGELRGQILAADDTREPALLGEKVTLGLLYDRARDGHGLDFQKSGDNYFLILYSHAEDGSPDWYLAVGDVRSDVFEGDLLRFSHDAGDSPPQTGVKVGTARIRFGVGASTAACNDGTDRSAARSLSEFDWTIGSEAGTWCLEPLIVGGMPPSPNFSGIWHAGSADDGWGLTISQQGSTLAVIIYYYDAAGNPRWALGSSANFQSGDSIEMLQFTGYCRSCPFFRETAEAGTLTLTFTEPSQAFAGNTVTIEVTYLGPEGGEWVRDQVPIRLLSEPAP